MTSPFAQPTDRQRLLALLDSFGTPYIKSWLPSVKIGRDGEHCPECSCETAPREHITVPGCFETTIFVFDEEGKFLQRAYELGSKESGEEIGDKGGADYDYFGSGEWQM